MAPAPICNQVERILSLEINQKSMAENFAEIKADVKEINGKFDALMEKLDEKYSAKRVEVAIKRAGGIIIGIVLSAMVYQVIIKK